MTYHIKDVVDVDVLQKIQDQFAEATNFAVIIVDSEGKPVTKHSNCSTFCNMMRTQNEYECFCHRSDAEGGRRAAKTLKPYIYRCHTGIVDFAAPIIYQGQYLGAMMAGQVLLEDEEMSRLDIITSGKSTWRDEEIFLAAYQELPFVPYSKVKAVLNTMHLFCNHIIENGISHKIEMELYKKDIKLAETKQKQLELENALKEAKLKILRSQINPHFLFNALNTISSLCLVEKAEKTQKIVYLLSDILRYSLKKSSPLVPLGDEVQYIEMYLQFLKTRFDDRIKFDIHVPKSMHHIDIPFMTLQPIIENAVIHGLEDKEEGGFIKVLAYSKRNDIIISIEDNGVGISDETLKDLLTSDQVVQDTNKSGHTTSLGLSNVNDRLVHFYGEDYSLKISSKGGIGTRVMITIPNNKESKND